MGSGNIGLPVLEVPDLEADSGDEVEIDLKADEGKKIVMDLVRGADVVVENFGPGTMDRLGYTDEQITALVDGGVVATED